MPTAQQVAGEPKAEWLDLGPGWLFEHIRDAVLVVEPSSGRIRLSNPAAQQLFGPLSGERVETVLPGIELDVEGTCELEVPIEVTISRLRDRRGKDLRLLVAREVSERRKRTEAEAARRVAQRELEERVRTERALIASEERLQATLDVHTFLDDASRELATSLDYATTLQVIARLPLQRLADMCIVQAVDDELMLDSVAVAHIDPGRDVKLQTTLDHEAGERRPAPRLVLNGATHALNGRPDAELWNALGLDTALQAAIKELDPWSVLLVPLLGRSRVLGVMILGSPGSDAYEPSDITVAENLARRCAHALEHALLYRTAQQAIAARDQFLSIASHELRAPLTRIKSHAEMLLLAQSHGQLDPDRLAWSAERINAAVDRLASLTKDVLDVSRMRGGQIPFRPDSLDLVELLKDLEPRLAEHMADGDRIVLELSDEPCPVLVDQDRIEQILANLLDNAAKYSPGGAEVAVRVCRVDDGVLLQVRDQGVGLPAGATEFIFEPFGRASNAEEFNVPGMGLGLHICRMIVERHGGRIWAESDGLTRGTTISVWLPFASASPMPAGDVQQRLTNQLTLAVGYCELLASSPELPDSLRAQAVEAMNGAHGAVATLGDLQALSH